MKANGKKRNRIRTSGNTNEVKVIKSPKISKPTSVPNKTSIEARIILGLKNVKSIIFAFFTILGVFFGIYSFYPRMSIQENQLLDPKDPFYYPFRIVNDGNVKIVDFSYELKISDIYTKDGSRISNSVFSRSIEKIPRIKVNGQHPIDLTKHVIISGWYIEKAEIFIRYQYSIPIIKLHFSDSTKFILLNNPITGYKWTEHQY